MVKSVLSAALKAAGIVEDDVLSSKDYDNHVVVDTTAGQKFSFDGSTVAQTSGAPLPFVEDQPALAGVLEPQEPNEDVEVFRAFLNNDGLYGMVK